MNTMQILPPIEDGQQLAEACSRVIEQRDQATQALGNQGVLR